MESLSVLVSEVAAIPAFDLAEKNLSGDREARMGKGATFQHVEGVERAGDNPLGVLAFQDTPALEPDQQFDDQEPSDNSNGRVDGHTVTRRLLRLLRHGATSLGPKGSLKKALAAGPATSRQLSQRRARRGPWRGRELSNISRVGHSPFFCPTTGGGLHPSGRRHPLLNELSHQTTGDRADVLEALGVPVWLPPGRCVLGAVNVCADHAEGVAACLHGFHPERVALFPVTLA